MLWRPRYTLSFRDVAEMLLEHGFEVTHETVRDWERFGPLVGERLRQLPRWLYRYNHRRPHSGVGGAVPASRL